MLPAFLQSGTTYITSRTFSPPRIIKQTMETVERTRLLSSELKAPAIPAFLFYRRFWEGVWIVVFLAFLAAGAISFYAWAQGWNPYPLFPAL